MSRYVKNFKSIDSLRQKLEVNRGNPDQQIRLTEAFVKLHLGFTEEILDH
jgi:hypothetical protein